MILGRILLTIAPNVLLVETQQQSLTRLFITSFCFMQLQLQDIAASTRYFDGKKESSNDNIVFSVNCNMICTVKLTEPAHCYFWLFLVLTFVFSPLYLLKANSCGRLFILLSSSNNRTVVEINNSFFSLPFAPWTDVSFYPCTLGVFRYHFFIL
jgi:hypothetical protein